MATMEASTWSGFNDDYNSFLNDDLAGDATIVLVMLARFWYLELIDPI